MSSTETLTLASRALEAFNHADWDEFRDLSHDDVVYVESGTGRRIEGIEAYLETLREWKLALPDVHGTIRRAVADGDLAAQDILWRGTHQGSLPTPNGPVSASGVEVVVTGTLWVTSRDGRVAEIEHHLDVLSLLGQIGALG
jgi:steroid delta-isomerase-like uncharacterized protein